MPHYIFLSAPNGDPAIETAWTALIGQVPVVTAPPEIAGEVLDARIVALDPAKSPIQVRDFLQSEKPLKADSLTVIGHGKPGGIFPTGNSGIFLKVNRGEDAPGGIELKVQWSGKSGIKSCLNAEATIHFIGCAVGADYFETAVPEIHEGQEFVYSVAQYLKRTVTASVCSVPAHAVQPTQSEGPVAAAVFAHTDPAPLRPPDPGAIVFCDSILPVAQLGVGEDALHAVSEALGELGTVFIKRKRFELSRMLIAPVLTLPLPGPDGTAVSLYRTDNRDYLGLRWGGALVAVPVERTEALQLAKFMREPYAVLAKPARGLPQVARTRRASLNARAPGRWATGSRLATGLGPPVSPTSDQVEVGDGGIRQVEVLRAGLEPLGPILA